MTCNHRFRVPAATRHRLYTSGSAQGIQQGNASADGSDIGIDVPDGIASAEACLLKMQGMVHFVKVKRSGDRDKAVAEAHLQHYGIDGDCAAFYHACIYIYVVVVRVK